MCMHSRKEKVARTVSNLGISNDLLEEQRKEARLIEFRALGHLAGPLAIKVLRCS